MCSRAGEEFRVARVTTLLSEVQPLKRDACSCKLKEPSFKRYMCDFEHVFSKIDKDGQVWITLYCFRLYRQVQIEKSL